MFKRIRSKLAVVLTVPLIILVVVAYLEVYGSLHQSHTVAAQSRLATTAIGPSGLVSALQTERNQAGLQLLGFDSKVALGVATSAEARGRVDNARAAFQLSIGSGRSASAEAYRPALLTLVHIERLRASLDDFHPATGTKSSETAVLASTLFSNYTSIIHAFLDANTRVASSVDNASLRTGIELLDVTLRQQEAESLAIRDASLATLGGGLTASGQMTAFITDVADFHNWTERALVLATGSYAPAVKAYVDGQAISSLNGVFDSYLHGAPVVLSTLLAASNPSIGPGSKSTVIPGAALQRELAALVSHRADQLRKSAQTRLTLFIALALLAAALAIAILRLASRSITGPLHRLAVQAETMAKSTLPAAVQSILNTPLGEDVTVPKVPPITVNTRDEVADVAAALTAVQDSAVELAVEQAVLRRNIADSFVNLGRRNQNLLGRQLDFISSLEAKETDAGMLDDLFRLDHLATRMRRNAESLLVLAGLESPRQWSVPVAIGDVIRASLAEVEDYRRVDVHDVDAIALPGSIAADLAHIIAELVENALVSSPPDTQVEVYGRTGDSDYMISVVDRGVGMSERDRERANRRLAGSESFTVAPSRYLGHYVAGHLAARYGLHVSLQESDAGGIKARISLPVSLLNQTALLPTTVGAPPPPPPAYDDSEHGPAGGADGRVVERAAAPPPVAAVAPAVRVPVAAPLARVPVAVQSARPAAPAPAVVPAWAGVQNNEPPPPSMVADRAPVPAEPPITVRAAPAPAAAGAAGVRPAMPRTTFNGPAEVSTEGSMTSGGLVRRVPGATVAPADDGSLLRRTPEEAAAAHAESAGSPAGPVAEAGSGDGAAEGGEDEEGAGDTSAHEVYRMLANLWSDSGPATSAPARTDRTVRKGND